MMGETGAMFVAQIKTGARIWVPMPKRLRDYLATWQKRGKYIVPSPKRPTEPWAHGQRKRDEMYEREHVEAMIAAADNARLRSAM